MDKRLKYTNINDGQKERIDNCKNSASDLLAEIERSCPNSREKSIAITKIEEAIMWASKSISHAE